MTEPKITGETERLLLRWFTLDDLLAFHELGTDPQVIRYVGNEPFASLDAARETLVARPLSDYATYGYGRFACVWKATGQVVGFCGPKFDAAAREVDLGYRFLPSFWGMGLATEASRAVLEYARRELGLRRLVGWVHPDNVASARVLTKLGFAFERKTSMASYPGVCTDRYVKLLDDGEAHGAAAAIRPAASADYPSFAQLFPEMGSGDRVPDAEVWTSTYVPSTWVATRDREVVGYCYFQQYANAGYVRNIVVAPQARQQGIGRALMQATADELRAHGKRSWRLNVMPGNRAAVALYERLGMREKYKARAFRFDWGALDTLPLGNAVVRSLTAERDAVLESLFDIPGGQLQFARGLGRILLEANAPGATAPAGLAVFDPKFPGAFPFRVTALDAVAPLLRAMRQHVPTDEHVNLVAEDDERLAALLTSVGSTLRHEIVHMQGPL